MRCPSCNSRPARRACPALGWDICPVCCGTKRQAEIRCPDTCTYLTSSRSHPPAAVRKQLDQDMAWLAPGLAGLPDPQQQLFFLCLTLVTRFRGEGFDAAKDADVADAAASLAATYETASKGLIYEHRAATVPAQRMAAEFRSTLDELGRERPAALARDAAVVLRRLEARVREIEKVSGSPVGFLEVAARFTRQVGPGLGDPDAREGLQAQPEPPGPSIILP